MRGDGLKQNRPYKLRNPSWPMQKRISVIWTNILTKCEKGKGCRPLVSKQSTLAPIFIAELKIFISPKIQKKVSLIFKVTSFRRCSMRNFCALRFTKNHMTKVTIALKKVMEVWVPQTTVGGWTIGEVLENTIIMITHTKRTNVGANVELTKWKLEKFIIGSRLDILTTKRNVQRVSH